MYYTIRYKRNKYSNLTKRFTSKVIFANNFFTENYNAWQISLPELKVFHLEYTKKKYNTTLLANNWQGNDTFIFQTIFRKKISILYYVHIFALSFCK